jgi:uncharacterized membrane protein YkoI
MKMMLMLVLSLVMLAPSYAGRKQHRATMSRTAARRAVLKLFPGAAVSGAELEKEHDTLVWSFDLKTDEGTREVWLDARSGKLIKSEMESPAAESAEKSADAAEAAALRKVPGTITAQKIKTVHGKTVRDFEIRTKKGIVVEVDVDSLTNTVIDIESEPRKPAAPPH